MYGNSITQKYRRDVIFIQSIECLLTFVIFITSYQLAGLIIYNHHFPFGIVDGILIYFSISILAVIMFGINHFYSFIDKPFAETCAKIIGTTVMLTALLIAVLYFRNSLQLSGFYFVEAMLIQIILLFLLKRFTSSLKTVILAKSISLVIGQASKERELMSALGKQRNGKLDFGSYEDLQLKQYVEKADNIYIADYVPNDIKEKVVAYSVLKGKKVFLVPQTYEIAIRNSIMTQVGDIPMFSVESFMLTLSQRIIKRTMDILLSIIALVLLSPLMLTVAIFIKLEDRGPVLYKQERSGLKGKPFGVMKFRSMAVDAEKYTGAVFAAEDDPRITRVGRIMRATRIDEIPQFLNVLVGSMSVIGPRPERPIFVEQFTKEIPEYINRLAVKPGITGLAQVMGNYTTTAQNKVKFDLVYVRNYSFLLDIKILFKTVKIVFTKEQATGFCQNSNNSGVEEFEFNDQELNQIMKKGNYNRSNRLIRTVIASMCGLVIVISASILFRYSALAMTIINVTEQSETVQVLSSLSAEEKSESLDGNDNFKGENIPNNKNQDETVLTMEEIQGIVVNMSLKDKAEVWIGYTLLYSFHKVM